MVRFLIVAVVALMVTSTVTAACGIAGRTKARVVHRERHVERVGIFHRGAGAGCSGVVGAGCAGSVGGCSGITVVPVVPPPKATQLPADPPKK